MKLSAFLFLTAAGIINAFGVTLFLVLLNVPIFLYGLRRQGRRFTAYSVYTVCVYSLMSFLIMDVLPINIDFASPLAGRDLLLCAIFGGVISGIGSGLTIRFGGAIDGIDVLSVIFAPRIGSSIGSFVMIFNTVLYTVCGISIRSWILPLYSIVTYFIGSRTVDYIVEGFDRAKCAMIVTNRPLQITEALNQEFHSGGTIIDAVGGYSREKKSVIYFIVNRFQIYKLRTMVHEIDKDAFISLQDVTDIFRREEK